eukprot:g6475.t1
MKIPAWNEKWKFWVATCENEGISSSGYKRTSHHVALYFQPENRWIFSSCLSKLAMELAKEQGLSPSSKKTSKSSKLEKKDPPALPAPEAEQSKEKEKPFCSFLILINFGML